MSDDNQTDSQRLTDAASAITILTAAITIAAMAIAGWSYLFSPHKIPSIANIATELHSPLLGLAKLDVSQPGQLQAYRKIEKWASGDGLLLSIVRRGSPIYVMVFYGPPPERGFDSDNFLLDDLVFLVILGKGANAADSWLTISRDAVTIPTDRNATMFLPTDESQSHLGLIDNILIVAKSSAQIRETVFAISKALRAEEAPSADGALRIAYTQMVKKIDSGELGGIILDNSRLPGALKFFFDKISTEAGFPRRHALEVQEKLRDVTAIVNLNAEPSLIARMEAVGNVRAGLNGMVDWVNSRCDQELYVGSPKSPMRAQTVIVDFAFPFLPRSSAPPRNDANPVGRRFFDFDGRPVMSCTGYHQEMVQYDQQNRSMSWAYFDTEEIPVRHPDGYHKEAGRYDERRNRIEWAYFDTDGKAMLYKDGSHKETARYDERRNRIEWAYFDTDEKPMLHKDGYHKATARYDDRRNRIEWAYFNADEKPMLYKDGYHKATARYDERGNQIEWAFFDTDGKAMLHQDGYHKATGRYDERGNRIEWAYFNADEKPMLYKDGYHKETGRYDERGNLIEVAYFDTDGKPTLHQGGYHKATRRYDERGNQIEWAFFDTDAKPMLYKDGSHKETGRYDERDNRIEWAYFDTDAKPTLHQDGYHKATARYDGRDNLIEWAVFDTEGNPTFHQDGHHKETGRHDERGNRIEWAYFDTDGKPMVYKNGYHKTTGRYDGRDNRIEWAFFDTDGKPTLHQDGHHKETGRYDGRGNLIEVAYFDTDGQDGYHKATARYDGCGNLIEVAYFDTDGKPTLHQDGYHKATARYDGRGNAVERAYFDTEEKPTLSKDGVHMEAERYQGDALVISYFDTDRRPTPNASGYMKMLLRGDHATFLDANDRPLPTEIVVTQVDPGSQGEALGIQPGDVFTSYGNSVLDGDYVAFISMREKESANGPARDLQIRRGGRSFKVSVKPGKIGAYLASRVLATDAGSHAPTSDPSPQPRGQ